MVDRVPRVAMAKLVLHGPQIRALVGQVEAAGVPERVWVHVLEAGDPPPRR